MVVVNLYFDNNDEEVIRIISAQKATLNECNMKNENENYEMKSEYDFSDGIRGRFYTPTKKSATIRLDDDVILYFKKKASEEKVG